MGSNPTPCVEFSQISKRLIDGCAELKDKITNRLTYCGIEAENVIACAPLETHSARNFCRMEDCQCQPSHLKKSLGKIVSSPLQTSSSIAASKRISIAATDTKRIMHLPRVVHIPKVSKLNEMQRITKQSKNEMVMNLVHGDWVMFKSPEPNVHLFWIGRAVSRDEWNNACWYKNEVEEIQVLTEDLLLHRGEYAINVQWYTQSDTGSPLDYVIEAAHPFPIVNNYSTLVLTCFDSMVQTVGKTVRIRVPRQKTFQSKNNEFGYAHPQLNLQTKAGDWFRSDFGNVYRMSEKTREKGIAMCECWSGDIHFLIEQGSSKPKPNAKAKRFRPGGCKSEL